MHVRRSWLTQFGLLFKRALLAQLRNPTDVTARLFLSTWVGALAGAPPACVHPSHSLGILHERLCRLCL